MSDRHQPEDQELVTLLGRLLAVVDPVPPDVVDYARAAYTWRDVDEKLGDIQSGSSE